MTEAADTGAEEQQQGGQEGADKEPDWKAEAEKWKGLARKHEDQWKQNADKVAEYDRLVEASKTDQERLEERATSAEQQSEKLGSDLARLNAAIRHGFVVQNEDGTFSLDEDALDLLGRGSQEELDQRAARIAALRGAGQTQNRQPDLRAAAGQRPVSNGEPNADAWIRQIAGRG